MSRGANQRLHAPAYGGVVSGITGDRMARASLWAALAPAARNEAFNLVNEPFRWERVCGAAYGMEAGPPQRLSLTRHMPLQADAWQRLARRHGLQGPPYDRLASWWFGDFVFNTAFDMVSDMGKIRRAGFTEAVEPVATIVGAIERLRAQRYLP